MNYFSQCFAGFNLHYETVCACGHCTQKASYRQVSHSSTPNIWLPEWFFVGIGLAALIVCLVYRMRLSQARIQEFLSDWHRNQCWYSPRQLA